MHQLETGKRESVVCSSVAITYMKCISQHIFVSKMVCYDAATLRKSFNNFTLIAFTLTRQFI